ncbi:MAG: N-glycosylase/DNA lyase [Candidatus Desulfofervidus sp.]|nr:N-glycosylase/DNA lyase [Candidatus Desulfofervidus sp.]
MHKQAIDQIIDTLKNLSYQQWEAYLKTEPEWQYGLPIKEVYPENVFICFMLTAGLNDYQLKGRAEVAYWPKLMDLAKRSEIPQTLDDLINLLEPFYQKERLKKAKIARLHRFLESKLAEYLWQAEKGEIAVSFEHVWKGLARTMKQPPHKKTIVFAMKCLFIAIRMLGQKEIKCDMPIPVDSRIKKITLEYGLLGENELAEKAIQHVWNMVLKEIQKRNPYVNIFHLDSYLWQNAGD